MDGDFDTEDDPFLNIVKPDDGENKRMSTYLKKTSDHERKGEGGGGGGSVSKYFKEQLGHDGGGAGTSNKLCFETSSHGTSSTMSTKSTAHETVTSASVRTPEQQNPFTNHSNDNNTNSNSSNGSVQFEHCDFGNGLEFGGGGSTHTGDITGFVNDAGFPDDGNNAEGGTFGSFGGFEEGGGGFATDAFGTCSGDFASAFASQEPFSATAGSGDGFGGGFGDDGFGDVDGRDMFAGSNDDFFEGKGSSSHGETTSFGGSGDDGFGVLDDTFVAPSGTSGEHDRQGGKSSIQQRSDPDRKREAWKKSPRTRSSDNVKGSHGCRDRRRGMRRNHSSPLDHPGESSRNHHDRRSRKPQAREGSDKSPTRKDRSPSSRGGSHKSSTRKDRSPSSRASGGGGGGGGAKERERRPPGRQRSDRRERRAPPSSQELNQHLSPNTDGGNRRPEPRRGSVSYTRSDGSLEPVNSTNFSINRRQNASGRHLSSSHHASHAHHQPVRRRASVCNETTGIAGSGKEQKTHEWAKERSRNQDDILNMMYRSGGSGGGRSSKSDAKSNELLGNLQRGIDAMKVHQNQQNDSNGEEGSRNTFGQFLKSAVSTTNGFVPSFGDGEDEDRPKKPASSRSFRRQKKDQSKEGGVDYDRRTVEGRIRGTLVDRVAHGTEEPVKASSSTDSAAIKDGKGLSYSDRIVKSQQN